MINKEIFYNINNILNRNKLKEEYVKKHLKNESNLIKEFQIILIFIIQYFTKTIKYQLSNRYN